MSVVLAVALGSGAVRLSSPAFVQPLKVFLIVGFIALATGGAIQIGLAVRRTPIPKGVSFIEGVRRAMTAYDARAAWAARHPWQMTMVTLACWILISIGAASRWAFYSTH